MKSHFGTSNRPSATSVSPDNCACVAGSYLRAQHICCLTEKELPTVKSQHANISQAWLLPASNGSCRKRIQNCSLNASLAHSVFLLLCTVPRHSTCNTSGWRLQHPLQKAMRGRLATYTPHKSATERVECRLYQL